MGGFGPSKL